MRPAERILVFDIETTNLNAEWGTILCIGYQILGHMEKPRLLKISSTDAYKKDHTDDSELVANFIKVWNSCDFVISWYGADWHFDEPYLRAKLLLNKIDHLVHMDEKPHIDLWRTSRTRLKLTNNRLAHVSEMIGIEGFEKTKVSPWHWRRAQAGYADGRKYVEEHCIADIDVLREVYYRFRQYVRAHPNLNRFVEGANQEPHCHRCGSSAVIRIGRKLLQATTMIMWRCDDCGGNSSSPDKKFWDLRNP